MASDYGYRLSSKAVADVEDIVTYLSVKLANPQAAASFLDKLEKTIQETQSFPHSGIAVQGVAFPDGIVRKKMVNNYIMFYLPDDEGQRINILRVVYGRRDFNEILRHMRI